MPLAKQERELLEQASKQYETYVALAELASEFPILEEPEPLVVADWSLPLGLIIETK